MLLAIQCNIGVDKMFETNTWNNQMNHAELIMSYSSHNRMVKDLNKREYKEYMDIKLRNDESYPLTNKSVPGTDFVSVKTSSART